MVVWSNTDAAVSELEPSFNQKNAHAPACAHGSQPEALRAFSQPDDQNTRRSHFSNQVILGRRASERQGSGRTWESQERSKLRAILISLFRSNSQSPSGHSSIVQSPVTRIQCSHRQGCRPSWDCSSPENAPFHDAFAFKLQIGQLSQQIYQSSLLFPC
jgi:hypothetical protein